MILALDPGLQDLGWAVVAPHSGRVAELGQLHQERDATLDESTCRARRIWRQAELLVSVIRRHRCTAIEAEAMSFGGPPKARFAMAISLGLSIGDLIELLTGPDRGDAVTLFDDVIVAARRAGVSPDLLLDAAVRAMLDHMQRVPWCRRCLEALEFCGCRVAARRT